MSYTNFKTIDDIKTKFDIRIVSHDALFTDKEGMEDIRISANLSESLQDNIPLALNINTEKARSELIIAPVLLEVRRLLEKKVSFFSGIEFNVDEKLGLSGYCDFLLSNSPDQVFLESPVVCVVEAKNENIRSGYGQCIAEMIAAKLFNDRKALSVPYILGAITTGSNWKFLKYQQETIFIDFEEYLISRLPEILRIFVMAIRGVRDNA
uniref:Type I restriction enzyme R protein N terminus (HSDR_N) n=1 Tax=Candidatus Kentrum sp. FM TaxID=2126340 RepID=A0A450VPW6_9GAMM|nr:MAG: hypothetical protein BECKFM1743A_GA0114220_1002612 [Candidatus Kentron sp. FM]VFJ45640.1 MAG: hypothetical protein BECKFM1743C_GA0114222_1002812 [Candidatus Kentron sp. FM]VFK06815.1 MAG: hypothetical protein BECKFM1743B_GA0114221_1002511 [Candidatus Kentron sp. FM]